MRRYLALVVALVVLLMVRVFGQGTVMPSPFFVATDNNGLIINAAKLCTYAAGTTTPQATYSDVDLAVGHQNTNPVVTNGSGRAVVYLSQTSYKFVLYTGGTALTCDGTQIWSRDNVTAIPSASGNVDVSTAVAGENLTLGQVVYLSDGSGSKNPGQWYRADAGNTYSSTLPEIGIATATIASGATGTVRLIGRSAGLSGLTIGVEYFVGSTGALTATLPANLRHVGHADTTTSLVVTSDPAPFRVGPNGVATTSAANGQLLIGRGSDNSMQLSNLTAGNGMSIVNTSGGITISSGVFAHTTIATAAPTGTASAIGVMMGLAGSITPMATGTVLFCVSANVGGGATGYQAQMRRGTGTAPANGAALTGTAFGTAWRDSTIANNQDQFGGCQLVTGLTVNAAVWYDIELRAVTAGTATANSVTMSAVEVP